MSPNVTAFLMYALIALLCSAACLFFFRNVHRFGEHTRAGFFFQAALLATSFFSLTDLFRGLRLFEIVRFSDPVCSLIEGLYILGSVCSCCLWFFYSENEQESALVRKPYLRALFSLPFVLFTLLVLTNPLHRLSFRFESGFFQSGSLNPLINLPLAALVLFSGISGLIRSFQNRYYVKRAALREIFVFAFAFLAAQTVEEAFGFGLPIRTLSATAVFFRAQDRILKSNIYRDRAAQINNRTVAENYLASCFDDSDSRLCFGVLDIDNFRLINDRFGHWEGDRALQLLAKALKSTAGGALVARYGSDEFAFIGNFGSDREVEVFLASLRKKLNQLSVEETTDFSLDFSVGYARKTSDVSSIPELIRRADRSMLQNRRQKYSVFQ